MELVLSEIAYSYFDWITGTFHFKTIRGFEDNAYVVIDENDLWKPKSIIESELEKLKNNPDFTVPLIESYAMPGDHETIYHDILTTPIIFKRISISEINGYEESDSICGHVFSNLRIGRDSYAYDYFFALSISHARFDFIDKFLTFHLERYFISNLYDFATFLLNLLHNHPYLWLIEVTGKERLEAIRTYLNEWIDIKLKLSDGRRTLGIPESHPEETEEAREFRALFSDDRAFKFVVETLSIENRSKGWEAWLDAGGNWIRKGRGKGQDNPSAACDLLNALIDSRYILDEKKDFVKKSLAHFCKACFGIPVGEKTRNINARGKHYEKIITRLHLAKSNLAILHRNPAKPASRL